MIGGPIGWPIGGVVGVNADGIVGYATITLDALGSVSLYLRGGVALTGWASVGLGQLAISSAAVKVQDNIYLDKNSLILDAGAMSFMFATPRSFDDLLNDAGRHDVLTQMPWLGQSEP